MKRYEVDTLFDDCYSIWCIEETEECRVWTQLGVEFRYRLDAEEYAAQLNEEVKRGAK